MAPDVNMRYSQSQCFVLKNQIISKAYSPNKAVAIIYLSLRKLSNDHQQILK